MSTPSTERGQPKYRFGIEPSAFRVGSLTRKVKELGNGIHKVAEHEGVVLWTKIVDGRGVDFRAFDKNGRERGIVIYMQPDPRLGPPTAAELRPQKTETVPFDAGSQDCYWICTPDADGGMTCWQLCA